MQWYQGDIGSAVGLAKANNAIFVVYCEGKDENSQTLTKYINSEAISSRLQSKSFVAIRIESDKPEYIQFCKIYQLVPVPSLFFIKNGIPIKVVTSVVKSSDEIIEAIDIIIKSLNEDTTVDSAVSQELPTTSQEAKPVIESSPETKPKVESSPEIVCKDGVCYKKEPEKLPETSSVEKPEETEAEKQEKIKRAMKLIEEKRIEKIKEEQRLEREREIKRRQEGKEVQNLKKWQDDQELQQLKDERKREKMQALEARRRVLEQIEDDKKERARRFNTSATAPEVKEPEKPVQAPTTPTTTSDSAKIQFKKPDGEAEIVTFDVTMLFGDLYSFVRSDILQGTNIKDFTLATVFPRREFTSEDFGKTLLQLNLAPSSVVLIIPGKKTSNNFTQNRSSVLPTNTDGSFFDMISALIMGLFSPIFALFAYVKGFVFKSRDANAENDAGKRKRDEESLVANDAAKKRNMNAYNQPEPSTSSFETGAIPKSATYKRVNPSSNIHRLHQDSDSDEERNTYNGNSTQQM
ncbi:unnamed protein product [Chironomus riparius]|uniref:UBX domain-containing protein 4 n=1 Tax=Chironomus riparius TaxID=315576 RepID=A0A9N9RPI6_9DIPT|nr:unnamed protein product [Chironomus riparius]